MVMIPAGLRTKNDYAGEGQQQFTRQVRENKKKVTKIAVYISSALKMFVILKFIFWR
jgi:hypothetical protein